MPTNALPSSRPSLPNEPPHNQAPSQSPAAPRGRGLFMFPFLSCGEIGTERGLAGIKTVPYFTATYWVLLDILLRGYTSIRNTRRTEEVSKCRTTDRFKRRAHTRCPTAPRSNYRAYDGDGAAAQPVRCRVRKQKVADRVHHRARGVGASVGLCRPSALCRHQDLGLNYRGHRSKEGQCVGAHDVVRGAVCGHHSTAGRHGNAGRRAARTALRAT